MRQKKNAERRVQAAAAAAEAKTADAKSEATPESDKGEKLDNEVDENAMGDNENNNNNNNNTIANGNANTNTNTNSNDVKKPRTSRADPIMACLSKSAVRMSDVHLLHGPHWLNDTILNFYFAYLEEVKYKTNLDFLFVTPEQSQCMLYMDDKELESLLVNQMKAIHKPFIFMAMNDTQSQSQSQYHGSGARWTLLVASRPDKCFFHFDSYGGSNTSSSEQLMNTIKDVLNMRNARFRNMRCLQQRHDYDCGIHVICMADQLTDYVNRFDCVDGVQPLHQDVIKAKRNQLIKLVAALGGHLKC